MKTLNELRKKLIRYDIDGPDYANPKEGEWIRFDDLTQFLKIVTDLTSAIPQNINNDINKKKKIVEQAIKQLGFKYKS